MLGPNEGFAGFWEIVATADFIITRGYRVITLQFPDSLLKQDNFATGSKYHIWQGGLR